MIPHHLILEGFTGIRDGLGLERLELDLEVLTEDARLIALIGENGSGKTTIIDNLHPYRLMPSRLNTLTSGYSPSAFSYYDQIYGAKAKKELIWEYGNELYRSILLFKNSGKTQKTEAYLQRRATSIVDTTTGLNQEWVPMELPDGTSSDGKTKTYDACLEHILGSAELYFTSAFSAQGRRSLSAYGKGEIKDLMSELLGLHRIRELGEKARAVGKGLQAELTRYREELTRIAGLEATLTGQVTQVLTAGSRVRELEGKRKELQHQVKQAMERVATARAAANLGADLEAKRKELTDRIVEINRKLDRHHESVTGKAKRLVEHKNKAKAAAAAAVDVVKKRIASVAEKAKEKQALLAKRSEIESAANNRDIKNTDLLGWRESMEVFTAKCAGFNDIKEKLQATRASWAEKNNLSGLREHRLKELTEQAALIDDVPCAGTDLQGRCSLLSNARDATNSMITINDELEGLRSQCQMLVKAGEKYKAELEAMGDPPADVERIAKQITELEREIQTLNALANQAPLIESAERDLVELNAMGDQAAVDLNTLAREMEDLETQFHTDVRACEKEELETSRELCAEREPLEKELATLPISDVADAIALAETELEKHERERDQVSEEVELAIRQHATLKLARENTDKAIAAGALVKAKAEHLNTEIAGWNLLAKAFSNDGIVALSIDDAGPALSALANDLLTECYGPRFTVAIRTQAETKKETLIETFDIVVWDAEREEEKSITDMSGGERIWINEALMRAIALYQLEAGGRHYGVLFTDESDGALDEQRKYMFVKMMRKVLDIGNYKKQIFISHTPELWDLADTVIDLNTFKETSV